MHCLIEQSPTLSLVEVMYSFDRAQSNTVTDGSYVLFDRTQSNTVTDGSYVLFDRTQSNTVTDGSYVSHQQQKTVQYIH